MGPFCVFIVCKNFKTFCVSGLAWLVHCSRFWHPACTRCKNDMHPLLLGMLPRSGISFAVLAVSTRKIPDPVQERRRARCQTAGCTMARGLEAFWQAAFRQGFLHNPHGKNLRFDNSGQSEWPASRSAPRWQRVPARRFRSAWKKRAG